MKVKDTLPFYAVVFVANCIYHWRVLSRILKCVQEGGKVRNFGMEDSICIWVELDCGLDVEWDAVKGWIISTDYALRDEKIKHWCYFDRQGAEENLRRLLEGVGREEISIGQGDKETELLIEKLYG